MAKSIATLLFGRRVGPLVRLRAQMRRDAMMAVYLNRFGEQVETALTETIIEH